MRYSYGGIREDISLILIGPSREFLLERKACIDNRVSRPRVASTIAPSL